MKEKLCAYIIGNDFRSKENGIRKIVIQYPAMFQKLVDCHSPVGLNA
jgi:hypothetical protein